jgi:hypothetical protein
MLTCTLHDWQNGFKIHDLKGRYFDREGISCSYDELLARAPANAQELVSDEAIAKRYRAVREAIDRMKADVQAAKLDVLIICGDDQHELFNDDLMPPLAITMARPFAIQSVSPWPRTPGTNRHKCAGWRTSRMRTIHAIRPWLCT